MEKTPKVEKMTTGLALEELEVQRVQLLPDRIEMHRRRSIRKRIRRQNLNCGGTCFITNA
jgi:hypothetical protein